MKKILIAFLLSLFFVVILFGARFYLLKIDNQTKFVNKLTTPTPYSYPKINNLADLESAFRNLSLENVPYNIEGLEKYNISFQNIKLLFPEISKNIKPDREIKLSVDAIKYVPGSKIWFEGGDVGSYDGCKNWLENLEIGPYKDEIESGNSCLNSVVSENSRVRKINNNIYFVNDTTNLHLLNYWVRNYQTYNLINNTILDVSIVYGEQEIDKKELKDIQDIFLEIEKLLP